MTQESDPEISQINEFEDRISILEMQNRGFKENELNSISFSYMHFQKLFSNMLNACIIYQAINQGEDFEVIDTNPAFEKIENVSKESIIGIKVSEAFKPHLLHFVDVLKRVYISGNSESVIFNYTNYFGIEKWHKNDIFKLDEDKVVAVFEDVTQLREKEMELINSEIRYKALSDATHEAVFFMVNSRCIAVNKTALQMFGYTEEEALGKHALSIIAEEYHAEVLHKIKTNYTLPYNSIGVRKNGSRFPIRILSRMFNYQGQETRITTIRDNSREMEKEKALVKSETKFRTYFEEHNAIKLQIDPKSKRILDANKSAAAFYGFSRKELISKSIYDLNTLPPKEVNKLIIRATSKKQNSFSFPHRLKNGEIRDVKVYSTPIDIEGEKTLFSIIQDVTEGKKAAEKLKKREAQLAEINKTLREKVYSEVARSRDKDHILIQQSRHAALGEMIGNIAHQWRQPLNEVSLLINDLEDANSFGILDQAYFEKAIENVYKRLKFMSETINDFSNMYTDDFKEELFNPKVLIEKLMQFAEGTMESNKIKIKLTCKHDFKVYGYPNMLSHVLLNLLNNSKDVLNERNIQNPTIWIRVIKYKQVYKISVLDNGKGVEKEISNKIFDPYFTTKKFNKGSGLGLYMAKTMLEKQMNGRIEFQNKEEGAEFKISFDLIN